MQPDRHRVVVSTDGLMPSTSASYADEEDYKYARRAHPLKRTLQRLFPNMFAPGLPITSRWGQWLGHQVVSWDELGTELSSVHNALRTRVQRRDATQGGSREYLPSRQTPKVQAWCTLRGYSAAAHVLYNLACL
jgi:hypothetical protein